MCCCIAWCGNESIASSKDGIARQTLQSVWRGFSDNQYSLGGMCFFFSVIGDEVTVILSYEAGNHVPINYMKVDRFLLQKYLESAGMMPTEFLGCKHVSQSVSHLHSHPSLVE